MLLNTELNDNDWSDVEEEPSKQHEEKSSHMNLIQHAGKNRYEFSQCYISHGIDNETVCSFC
jgi:hypothetical protein